MGSWTTVLETSLIPAPLKYLLYPRAVLDARACLPAYATGRTGPSSLNRPGVLASMVVSSYNLQRKIWLVEPD
jgi:hypothetical protein